MKIEAIPFEDLSTPVLIEILSWRNHPEIRKWMYTSEEITRENHLRYVKSLPDKNDCKYWFIKQDDVGIGVCSLTRINTTHRYSLGGLYAKPEGAPKGSGYRVLTELCNLAFHQLDLNLIRLEALESNLKAREFYERFGFHQEGILRDFVLRENQFESVVSYSLRKSEYEDL